MCENDHAEESESESESDESLKENAEESEEGIQSESVGTARESSDELDWMQVRKLNPMTFHAFAVTPAPIPVGLYYGELFNQVIKCTCYLLGVSF